MAQTGKPMRLDLDKFQKQKRSGALVVGVILVSALIAFGLIAYMEELTSAHSVGSIPDYEALERIVEGSEKPVAVMFDSPTCPMCRWMYPYWAKLEEKSSTLPVSFYHITYGIRTAEAFRAYQVYETPTFIVFVDGKPVARHVGGFEGENITRSMLSWALGVVGLSLASTPEELAQEGLQVFNSKCSSCHPRIGSLDRSSLQEWVEEGLRLNDRLAYVIREAFNSNKTLEEYYGGYGVLSDVVASMRKYVDISSYELDRATYLLSYISHVVLGVKPPEISPANMSSILAASSEPTATPLGESPEGLGGLVGAIGALAAFVAGVVAAFSPCVLPLLVAEVAMVGASGARLSALSCGLCGLSSFAGVVAVASLFAVVGALIAGVQQVLLPAVAVAIMAAGAAAILGVPVELEGLFKTRRGGIVGFCAAYGLLAVQCSLPLVAGSLLLVAGAGAGLSSLIVAVSFALGISVPLAAVLYVVSRVGSRVVDRVMRHNRLLNIVGGVVLFLSGILLLAYSIGLI